MSLTTDPNDPKLKEGQKNKTGQHEIYLVLSDEERAKGFIRPYRSAYIHVGRKMNYPSINRMLKEPEKNEMNGKFYVAVLDVIGSDGSILGGRYVTQDELDAWKEGKRTGGCGAWTSMGRELSETYATNPKFYGATFCTGCNKHLPVNEFVWDGTNEEVGS